jgi:hypothetical protein
LDFVLGLSKQSFNIAARTELAQYSVDVFIKVQSLNYLARISSDGNNPLIHFVLDEHAELDFLVLAH